MRYINDNPLVWAKMWEKQVEVGMIPITCSSQTGPQACLRYHLQKLYIYQEDVKAVGLSHTARGPSMSCVLENMCNW